MRANFHTSASLHEAICIKCIEEFRHFGTLANLLYLCVCKNRYINQGIYDKEKTSAAVVE